MITDPVTDFPYPEAWENACTDEATRKLAASGLGVLTADGTVLRRGFTTGTTAAAACKAAVLSLKKPVAEVSVTLPCGLTVRVSASGADGVGRARKFAGDYKEDITAALLFVATAQPIEGNDIILEAGEGIGRFVRDTPRYQKGEPAISETAGNTILLAITDALKETNCSGVDITLTIPDGQEIGAQTLNPKVGVEGGVSVLGSTGLVEPWDDHLTESAFERIRNAEQVVLTTGRVGLRYSRLLFPDHEAILVGKFMEQGIEAASGKAILCGLPALILKFLNPDILVGTGYETVEELQQSPNWEIIVEEELDCARKRYPELRVVLVNREGQIIGDTQ